MRIGLTDSMYYLVGQISFIRVIGSGERFKGVSRGGGVRTEGLW